MTVFLYDCILVWLYSCMSVFLYDCILVCLYSLYAVGTVKGSRKVLPDILKKNDRMHRGKFMFRTEGCVAAIKWPDNKPGLSRPRTTIPGMISDPKQVTWVKRKNRDGTASIVPCPATVAEYSAIMGGVDRFDQRWQRGTQLGCAYSNDGTVCFTFSLTVRLWIVL